MRIGENPDPILKVMTLKGLPSANYIKGFHELHNNRNPSAAIPHLKRALDLNV